MNYIEIKIPKPAVQDIADLLVDELSEIGFEGFIEGDKHLIAYIPEKDYSNDLLEGSAYLKSVPRSNIELSVIPDQNWNEVWERNYPPVKIAGICFIRAPFHEADPDTEFDIVLKPKMAFGTAHHETTAMMIEILLKEKLTGKSILDMGCGTAVLAILAAKIGAKDITAIDIDEWAYSNALENIALNDLDFINVFQGDAGLLEEEGKFDLILANINKNILLNDMETYGKVLKKGGKIIFSGFYLDDLDAIKQTAKPTGMKFVSNINRNNWVAAVFVKQ